MNGEDIGVWASDIARRLDVSSGSVIAVVDMLAAAAQDRDVFEYTHEDGGRDALLSTRFAAAVTAAVDELAEPRQAPKVRLVARDAESRPGLRVWIVQVDGRPVGILGDERPWRGWRFGSLRWWAALRDTEDRTKPAEWNTGPESLPTRKAALAALLAELDARRGAP